MEHKRVKKAWTKPVLRKIDLPPKLRRKLLKGRPEESEGPTQQK